MTKLRFKLLAGTYSEGKEFYSAVGLNHKKGDAMPIVTSEYELDKKFKNKFERIQDAHPIVDDDDDDDDDDDNTPDPVDDGDDVVITLKAVRRKPKMWDVVKVVDGVNTDEAINDDFLKRKDALALVKAGYQEEE